MTLQPTRFELRLTEVDDRSVRLEVEGEIDLLSSPAFSRALHSQISEGRNVVLDFSQTRFMDSSGVKVVIQAIELSRSHSTRLCVDPDLPHQIHRLFEITGVASILRSGNADLISHPH